MSNGFSSGKGLKVTDKISVPPFVTLICYESLFSNEIIDKVNNAKWLVNITNDAWFGKKSGPNQHLAISRMLRALNEFIIDLRPIEKKIEHKQTIGKLYLDPPVQPSKAVK